MTNQSDTIVADDEDGLEETLLAACADRSRHSSIPESLTERLFFVREQMERVDGQPPAGPCLLVSGPRFEPRWFAADAATSIGRDSACTVVIPDNLVSRRHALLERDEDHWVIRDLESQNGLRVNGTRVKEHPLRSGDVIEISEFALIFMD